VGQALRNVCYSDVSRRHFLNKIAIVRTFSYTEYDVLTYKMAIAFTLCIRASVFCRAADVKYTLTILFICLYETRLNLNLVHPVFELIPLLF